MKYQLMIPMLAVAALTACTNDTIERQNESYEIRLGANVLDINTTRAATDVQGQLFDAGEKVAVFIEEVKADGQAEATVTTYGDVTNHKSEYTVVEQSGDVMTMTRTPTEYYPTSGHAVNLYAWYPSTAVTSHSSAPVFTIASDQSNITTDAENSLEANRNYKNSDLMYAEKLDQARTSSAVNLPFKHLLSKIVIQLKAGESFATTGGYDRLAGAKVELVGILPSVDLNKTGEVLDGTVSEAKGTKTLVTVTNPTVQSATGSNTFNAGAAIIPAQDFNETVEFIRITLKDGGVLKYYLPAKEDGAESDVVLSVKAGMVYTYTVTVNLTGITLTSSITKWDDDTASSLENSGNVAAGMDNN